MSTIITKKIKGGLYLYESTSYRDEKGRPRTNRVYIGKVNPDTGSHEYTKAYLERLRAECEPSDSAENIKRYSDNDIKRSKILEYGASYLYRQIAERIGLCRVLHDAMPDCWRDVFTIACYLISTEEPLMYCDNWVEKTDGLPGKALSASSISRLFKSGIDCRNRNIFYQKWAEYRQEQEYLALDITSVSSYSKFISEVEWGHNRDKDKLPQVNVCLILGEKTRVPVFQAVYNGSLTDVSTLKTTLKMASSLSINNMMLVMDKGFYSKNNLNVMLNDGCTKFMVAASFNNKLVCGQVEHARHRIDKAENAILLGDDTILGITRELRWDSKHRLYAHIYYNAVGAAIAKTALYGQVASLVEKAEADPDDKKFISKFKKYLIIDKAEGSDTFTINIRQDVLDKQLAMSGWLVIFSNHISDTSEAIHIYRAKDAVEKGFNRFKNSLEMERLRVHSSESMENKAFVAFIGLIIMSYMHKVMAEKGLYSLMTMKSLVHTLEKLRVQYINDNRILFPLTKGHKDIFDAFCIPYPQ